MRDFVGCAAVFIESVRPLELNLDPLASELPEPIPYARGDGTVGRKLGWTSPETHPSKGRQAAGRVSNALDELAQKRREVSKEVRLIDIAKAECLEMGKQGELGDVGRTGRERQ